MSTSIKKTYSKKEYEKHGNFMYDLGKASAFQSILKTEVIWSVNLLSQPHGFQYKSWNLDTVIFGSGAKSTYAIRPFSVMLLKKP